MMRILHIAALSILLSGGHATDDMGGENTTIGAAPDYEEHCAFECSTRYAHIANTEGPPSTEEECEEYRQYVNCLKTDCADDPEMRAIVDEMDMGVQMLCGDGVSPDNGGFGCMFSCIEDLDADFIAAIEKGPPFGETECPGLQKYASCIRTNCADVPEISEMIPEMDREMEMYCPSGSRRETQAIGVVTFFVLLATTLMKL